MKDKKIKILWIVNMVLPELAKHLGVTTSASGTWMEDLSDKISQYDGIDLAVACVFGNEFKTEKVGNITYFLLPGNGKTMLFYNKNLEVYWKQIEESFCPNIVHIHGTEYSHSISYMRNYPDKKYLLTIQGAIGKIAEKSDGELDLKTKLTNRTMRENLRFNGMIEQKILMKKNIKYEREIIERVKYATGRTDWDKAYIYGINPKCKYFRAFYNLRAAFYGCDKWDIEKTDGIKIYGSTSCGSPLKGGHIILKALAIVKEKYPDVKAVFIAPADDEGNLKITSGYTKYIAALIDELGLKDNLKFYNRLNTNEVIETMNSCRVCVIPSAMENASATLRESMDLGVPSVAAYRGGMMDLITSGINGFHYDFGEYETLAQRIIELLDSKDLSVSFSENAKKTAAKWHDREKNISDMINIYLEIMEEN